MSRILRITLVMAIILGLAGCATTAPYAAYKNKDAQQIFTSGERNLAKGKYGQSTKDFEALDALYPFGPYAQRGQLDIIYAYYKNDDAASALAAADRYIRLYPRANDVDYAYYMKGLVNFGRNDNWFDRLWPNDPSQRDLSYMQESFATFNDLVQFFPDSPYTADAQRRMVFIRNVMAQHELDIAQFYFIRKAYVAAANRATGLVEHYQGAPQVPEALAIMVKSYQELNQNLMAQNALQVLLLNYPDSRPAKSFSSTAKSTTSTAKPSWFKRHL